MPEVNQMPFWDIQASDFLPIVIGLAILMLAYSLIRGARNYLHIQAQFSAIVLIAGVLAILVYLGANDKLGEDGLIGIIGSLIGYVLGSMRPLTGNLGKQSDEK